MKSNLIKWLLIAGCSICCSSCEIATFCIKNASDRPIQCILETTAMPESYHFTILPKTVLCQNRYIVAGDLHNLIRLTIITKNQTFTYSKEQLLQIESKFPSDDLYWQFKDGILEPISFEDAEKDVSR